MFTPHRWAQTHLSFPSASGFDTHRPTTQPSSLVSLLDLCLAPRTSGVPKKTAEEYTAIPDLPALRTSYPGLAVAEDGGEEEIWTLWIPSKASMSLSGSAETHQTRAGFSLVAYCDPDVCRCQTPKMQKRKSYILQLNSPIKFRQTNLRVKVFQ